MRERGCSLSLLTSDGPQSGSQTLLGERLLKKSDRLNSFGSSACPGIGVGRHEYAADAEAAANFVSGIDSVAGADQGECPSAQHPGAPARRC